MGSFTLQKYLEMGFLRSVLSALEEQSPLETPLSDPLHAVFLSFSVQIRRAMEETNISVPHILGPLEQYLTFHLTNPTVTIFPEKASEAEEDWLSRWATISSEFPPIVSFLTHILGDEVTITETVQFVQRLLKSALEARRKETVVVEDMPEPLLLSTKLHPDQATDEIAQILDAASSFLISRSSLSTADAADVLLFLAIFENLFFRSFPFNDPNYEPEDPPDPIHRAHEMSMSDDFRNSLARLLVLSVMSGNAPIAMKGRELVLCWTKVWNQESLSSLLESGTVKTLAHISSDLCTPHSKDEAEMDDLIAQVVIQSLDVCDFEAEVDETNENGRTLEQFVVDEILIPTRKSLVASARKESKLMEMSIELDRDVNVPHLMEYMKEVWEEVRLEAVGIVENEPSSAVPSLLTLDLFSKLPFESIVSALSSLSSFITAKPSPADTIASCASIFLYKLRTDLRSYISSSSFPATVARTLPPLLATKNVQLFGHTVNLLKAIITHFGRDHPERMAEHGLFFSLMDVLRMKKGAESHPQEKGSGKIETLETINTELANAVVDIIVLSLSRFTCPSPFNLFGPIDADTNAIGRIALEKILEPCEGFIASSVRVCLTTPRPLDAFNRTINMLRTVCRVESRFPRLSEFVERNGFHLVLMNLVDSTESILISVVPPVSVGSDSSSTDSIKTESFFPYSKIANRKGTGMFEKNVGCVFPSWLSRSVLFPSRPSASNTTRWPSFPPSHADPTEDSVTSIPLLPTEI
ncbi:hypothetical protein BLNAU_24061 [Blattamonas nauphoetae]|uniref:Uncharacterized protein n=1 Tax=Blattamonas nauphoetae TaxID=2049346 RepID=A0ABQ9WNH9_9EUKA|nr:hypothetical protein BLNAU_24061 [Blattamonas nauphoetae]